MPTAFFSKKCIVIEGQYVDSDQIVQMRRLICISAIINGTG